MRKKNKNMVVIKVTGGLGNQMFCYAMYRYWEMKGVNVFFDVDDLIMGMPQAKSGEAPTKFVLKDYFPNTAFKKIGSSEYKNIFDHLITYPAYQLFQNKKYFTLLRKAIRRIKGKYFNSFQYNPLNKTVINDDPWNRDYFINGINNKSNFWIRGLFQNFYCSTMIKDILTRDFSFTKELPDAIVEILHNIENRNAVSIHVRRGSYMFPYWYYTNGFVCSLQYYKNAINYIISYYPDAYFYIFSDDAGWVKSNLNFLTDCFIVDTSAEEYSTYYDLFLMSKCRYNIISNSTFSWWGAFLNKNGEKKVLVPTKYSDDCFITTDEICPQDWIRIPSTKQAHVSAKYFYNAGNIRG
jgi:hypothetical protein